MKVVNIITNFSEKGGAEMMLARLINKNKNDEHIIISLMNISESLKKEFPTYHVRFIELRALNIFTMFFSIFKLAMLLNKEKCDVIQCWMYHANVIGLLAKILAHNRARIFWGIRHSLDDMKSESFSTRISIILSKLLSRYPSGIVFCSKKSMAQHLKYGFKNKENIFIPNGYIIPRYKRKLNSGFKVIGIAGRFHKAKNYECFLKAAALLEKKHTELRFVAAGRGINLNNLEIPIGEAGLSLNKIDLLGEVSDMSNFFQKIDIFVLSSITEGFPNVIAEAMSHGVPCVSTDVGDASYIINDPDRIVPVSSPEQLSAAIEKLLYIDDSGFMTISNKARKRIEEKFSIEKIASQYLSLYKG